MEIQDEQLKCAIEPSPVVFRTFAVSVSNFSAWQCMAVSVHGMHTLSLQDIEFQCMAAHIK